MKDGLIIFYFILKYAKYCDNVRYFSIIRFYSNGDGDFRLKFEIDANYEEIKEYNNSLPKLEIIFDVD